MSAFVLTPLPVPLPDLDRLDPAVVRRVVADARPGLPCRRCLRDAEEGEAVVLLTYDPFLGTSPYRQAGPVYVHERDCAPGPLDGAVPEQLTRRTLSVRAFDTAHLMVGARLVPGTELAATASTLLDDPGTAYLHVHNAGPGCFAVRIDRP